MPVFVWGRNDDGELGLSKRTDVDLPTALRLPPPLLRPAQEPDAATTPGNIVQCSCGSGHTLLLTSGGVVCAIGRGDDGRLGLDDGAWHALPVAVPLPKRVVFVACGSYHSACISADRELYTFGGGFHGKLGHGDEENQPTPRRVEALAGHAVLRVACGSRHTVVLALEKPRASPAAIAATPSHDMQDEDEESGPSSGSGGDEEGGGGAASSNTSGRASHPPPAVWSFGHAPVCGTGEADGFLTLPKRVDFPPHSGGGGQGEGGSSPAATPPVYIGQISACGSHTLAVTTDGLVYAWGHGTFGRLGNGSEEQCLRPSPIPASLLSGVVAVATGGFHSLAIDCFGRAFAWGGGEHGALGLGTTSNQTYPCRVTEGGLGEKIVVAAAAGWSHSLLLTDECEVYATGNADHGKLGLARPPPATAGAPPPGYISSLVPRRVDALKGHPVVSIASYNEHCVALTEPDGPGALHAQDDVELAESLRALHYARYYQDALRRSGFNTESRFGWGAGTSAGYRRRSGNLYAVGIPGTGLRTVAGAYSPASSAMATMAAQTQGGGGGLEPLFLGAPARMAASPLHHVHLPVYTPQAGLGGGPSPPPGVFLMGGGGVGVPASYGSPPFGVVPASVMTLLHHPTAAPVPPGTSGAVGGGNSNVMLVRPASRGGGGGGASGGAAKPRSPRRARRGGGEAAEPPPPPGSLQVPFTGYDVEEESEASMRAAAALHGDLSVPGPEGAAVAAGAGGAGGSSQQRSPAAGGGLSTPSTLLPGWLVQEEGLSGGGSVASSGGGGGGDTYEGVRRSHTLADELMTDVLGQQEEERGGDSRAGAPPPPSSSATVAAAAAAAATGGSVSAPPGRPRPSPFPYMHSPPLSARQPPQSHFPALAPIHTPPSLSTVAAIVGARWTSSPVAGGGGGAAGGIPRPSPRAGDGRPPVAPGVTPTATGLAATPQMRPPAGPMPPGAMASLGLTSPWDRMPPPGSPLGRGLPGLPTPPLLASAYPGPPHDGEFLPPTPLPPGRLPSPTSGLRVSSTPSSRSLMYGSGGVAGTPSSLAGGSGGGGAAAGFTTVSTAFLEELARLVDSAQAFPDVAFCFEDAPGVLVFAHRALLATRCATFAAMMDYHAVQQAAARASALGVGGGSGGGAGASSSGGGGASKWRQQQPGRGYVSLSAPPASGSTESEVSSSAAATSTTDGTPGTADTSSGGAGTSGGYEAGVTMSDSDDSYATPPSAIAPEELQGGGESTASPSSHPVAGGRGVRRRSVPGGPRGPAAAAAAAAAAAPPGSASVSPSLVGRIGTSAGVAGSEAAGAGAARPAASPSPPSAAAGSSGGSGGEARPSPPPAYTSRRPSALDTSNVPYAGSSGAPAPPPVAASSSGPVPVLSIGAMEPDTFRDLLHFVYTDQLPPHTGSDPVAAVQLYAAADRFSLERLMGLCHAQVVRTLTPAIAARVLLVCLAYPAASPLLEEGIRVAVSSFDAVSKTEEFALLPQELLVQIVRRR